MTEVKHTITIVNASIFARQAIRLLAILNGVIVPIGVGVLVDSAAMQWAGFILGFFVVGGIAKASMDKDRFTTVDAAKARLDQMKAAGDAP
jgi:hypothetical protein